MHQIYNDIELYEFQKPREMIDLTLSERLNEIPSPHHMINNESLGTP
jgi:hypothetical protein